MKEIIETKCLTQGDWIIPDWPAPKSVHAYTTTRSTTTRSISYLSDGYSGFNLALHVGDDDEKVQRNRSQLSSRLNLASDRLCWLNQVHGQHIISADDSSDYQRTSSTLIQTADGCDTQEANIACIVMTADCLPVLLCDQSGTHVSAIHAGWRSLAGGILTKVVERFQHPKSVMAWFGPAISQKHFEVGLDVYQTFTHSNPENKTAFMKSENPDKWQADIYQLARNQLQKAGITKVYGGDFCTFDDEENFFSYRRDGATSGRMASVIYIG